jgi:hypothetical protein
MLLDVCSIANGKGSSRSGTTNRTGGSYGRTRGNVVKHITRSRLLEIWFATVALVVVAGVATGVDMTPGTGIMLLALCLVPPLIILLMWPGVQPPTIAEVLHDGDGRR